MYKRAYIKQPAGIGDIFYCLKIAQCLKAEEVIWPVADQYYEVLKKHIIIDPRRNVNFVKLPPAEQTRLIWDFKLINLEEISAIWNSEYHKPYCFCSSKEENNNLYLPLQHADRLYSDVLIMESKYKMANSFSHDWLRHFNFKRDHEKEDKLFKLLNLSENEEYALVSKNYGTPPDYKQLPINGKNGLRQIQLELIDGYNVFDWCKVIEEATEIHMVDTCFIYIMEHLNLKAKELNLFSRRGNDGCIQIRHIPKKINWNFK